MLILLPPSESKLPGGSGPAYAPGNLPFAGLAESRQRIADALVALSRREKAAAKALGLGPTQLGELEVNRLLRTSPTRPAIERFTGVLYDALDYASLTPAAQQRANESLLIMNALTGVAAPTDFVPNFRMSGDVSLPRIGNVALFWRKHLESELARLEPDLLIDARSGVYVKFWKCPREFADRAISVRVVQAAARSNGARPLSVSHDNKATKGWVVRDLMASRRNLPTPQAACELLSERGWQVELIPAKAGSPAVCEVVLRRP